MDIYQKIIHDNEILTKKIKKWQGKKIIFTNGCFDILHLGHTEYLNKAKTLGDKLIVGLNSDKSVQKIKGIYRPINPQNARAKILASLHCVDMVVIFTETTPEKIIQKISPHILVKGNDYKEINKIVGASWVIKQGGKIITLPFIQGFSTTNIIQKIYQQPEKKL